MRIESATRFWCDFDSVYHDLSLDRPTVFFYEICISQELGGIRESMTSNDLRPLLYRDIYFIETLRKYVIITDCWFLEIYPWMYPNFYS